ncbi:hypothetical protein ERJ75_000914600 [Trypanosoma vivax]|nr:hypothetical protein ERJ75_000914600 [Trypanosoma vivax]
MRCPPRCRVVAPPPRLVACKSPKQRACRQSDFVCRWRAPAAVYVPYRAHPTRAFQRSLRLRDRCPKVSRPLLALPGSCLPSCQSALRQGGVFALVSAARSRPGDNTCLLVPSGAAVVSGDTPRVLEVTVRCRPLLTRGVRLLRVSPLLPTSTAHTRVDSRAFCFSHFGPAFAHPQVFARTAESGGNFAFAPSSLRQWRGRCAGTKHIPAQLTTTCPVASHAVFGAHFPGRSSSHALPALCPAGSLASVRRHCRGTCCGRHLACSFPPSECHVLIGTSRAIAARRLLLCRSGTLLAFPPSRPQRVLRRFFARNAASNGVVVMSFAKEFPPVGQRCGDASVSNALRHEARPMACADRTDPSLSRASAVCARAKGPE